jgi:hypothetical protein
MRDKLIITGVVIAVVFTFLGYSKTKKISQKISVLEQNVMSLVKAKDVEQAKKEKVSKENQSELSRQAELLDQEIKPLKPEEAIPIIEKITESLIKIIKATKEEKKE